MIFCLLVPTHRVHGNVKIYRDIIETLHSNGHSLDRDWILPAYYQGTKSETRYEVDDILLSVQRADAVIADVSSRGTFGIGFAVALALESSKPTLLLRKKCTASGLILEKLQNDKNVTYREFDEENVAKYVKDFVDDCGAIL